ncbi:MAG: thioether cross-link-forming SCIFF peptide maturase [Moorellales bacterium]
MLARSHNWWRGLARREDVHWFRYRDRAFLLDANTAAVYQLDPPAVALLEALADGASVEVARQRAAAAGFSFAEADEALRELEDFHRRGWLLGPDPLSRLEDAEAAGRLSVPTWTKALCLNVAHACNLRCAYCFAGQGRFGGEAELMPPEVALAAVDYLLRQSPPGAELEIDFFGGEPLLNFGVVRRTVEYGEARAGAEGKELRFTLTTNALRLDREKLRFLNDHQVQLIFSLDGRPGVHDRLRRTPEGGGSYAQVLPAIQEAVASRDGTNYYIRGTFTRFNRDFSQDVAHLLELGFRRLSLEPVVASPHQEYALRLDDLPLLVAEYDRVVDLCLEAQQAGSPLEFFHFQLDLEPGLCLPKRLRGCGAGHQYLAVTPSGELYPCHQFVGQREFCLGDLGRGIVNRELQARLAGLNVLNKRLCRSCWARYFCGGGCHAANWLYGGDLEQPYPLGCELVRKRLECAIYLQCFRDNP